MIQRSFFNFYSNNIQITKSDCDSEKIFSHFKYLFPNQISTFTLNENKYPEETCSLIFKNSLTRNMVITNMADSFVKKIFIRFANDSKYNCNNLNSSIQIIQLQNSYNLVLTRKILNTCVFKRVNFLFLTGFKD